MPDHSFLPFLGEIADGELLKEVEDKFADLIADCQHSAATGGKGRGTITLTINIQFDRGAADVDGDVKTKPPKTRHPRSLFYANEDGRALVRRDPRQAELPMRNGPTTATALKIIP